MTLPPWPPWPPWRTLIGPIVTLAAAGGVLLLEKYLIRVPNPGAITLLVVAFAAYLGGLASGLVSAAIRWRSRPCFSDPGEPLLFTSDKFRTPIDRCDSARLATACMIGMLQARARAAPERSADAARLQALRSAMDQSDIGMVLLDSDLRAQFINRAFVACGTCRTILRIQSRASTTCCTTTAPPGRSP